MSDRDATVVGGARGPVIDLGSLPNAAEETRFSGDLDDDFVVFVSNSKGLMIQLKKAFSRVIGDEVLHEPHVIVRFNAGILRLHKVEDAWTIDTLRKCKSYGMGRSFWDASEAKILAEEASYEAFMAQVTANPVLERKLRERLKIDARMRDLDVPEALRPREPIKPIQTSA